MGPTEQVLLSCEKEAQQASETQCFSVYVFCVMYRVQEKKTVSVVLLL